MEHLTNLMRLIDLNSDNVSEGHYLEMCNSIKQIHDIIVPSNSNYEETESDSDDDDSRRFILREVMSDNTHERMVPFMPIRTERGNRYRYYEDDNLRDADADSPAGHLDNEDEDDSALLAHPDEENELRDFLLGRTRNWERDHIAYQNDLMLLERAQREYEENELKQIQKQIADTRKLISKTKPRQRITETVRKAAIKERADELGIRLHRYTLGCLLDAGHDVGNARAFFKNYLNDYNENVNDKLKELNDTLEDPTNKGQTLLRNMNVDMEIDEF